MTTIRLLLYSGALIVPLCWNVGSGFQFHAASTTTAIRRKRPVTSSSRPLLFDEPTLKIRPPLTRRNNEDDEESTTTGTTTPLSQELGNLPPVIQKIADDRKEFQMNLGRAMDTLRRDMPDILHKTPDFSIFDDNVHVVDPSGLRLTGLDGYKSAFAFLQTFVRFWFAPRSGLQFRMVYDFGRSSIRISWNAILIPKLPLGRPLYVDGVSYYQLDVVSGKIVEHRIEKFMINNTPVEPPYGIFSLLQQQDLLRLGRAAPAPRGVPAGVGAGATMMMMVGEEAFV